MSLDAQALELARAVGWVGGVLYVVDMIGARLNRWRMDRRLERQMGTLVFPGNGTPPPPPFPPFRVVPRPDGPTPQQAPTSPGRKGSAQ